MAKKSMPRCIVGRKEIEKYRYLSEGIHDENLQRRAQGSMEYFVNHAVWYKRLWQWLSFLAIILPAIATFLAACFQDVTCLLAGITATTTIVSSMLALSKCTDKKTSYRNSAEALKRELSLYLTSSGEYRKCGDQIEEKDHLLAERIENLIKNSYTKISALEQSGNHLQK